MPWSGTSIGALTFTDVTSGTVISCTSSSMHGTAVAIPAGPLSTATGSVWMTCTGPLGLTFTIAQVNTWSIASTAVNSISLHFAGSGCSFNVTGSANATYNSTTQVFKFAPIVGSGAVLTVSSLSGCFGIIHNGDAEQFAGSYQL